MENPYHIDLTEEFERLSRYISKQQPRTLIAKTRFLQQYRECYGNIKRACERSGIERKTFYNWRDSDLYFRELLPLISEGYAKEDAQGTLMDLIRKGHGASVRKFLRKYHPDYKQVKIRKLTFGDNNYPRDSRGRFKSFDPSD